MNKDIKIMIELQGYWDKVLNSQVNIEKCNQKITDWNNRIAEKISELSKLNEEIKEFKVTVKENENELSELDDRVNKITERKNLLKSQRELDAQDAELDKINVKRGEQEENLIMQMDELDDNEKVSSNFQNELQNDEEQSKIEMNDLNEKISQHEKNISDNEEKYNQLVAQLSASVKPKFMKLIKAKGGKAIAPVTGEICGNCNFQIPIFLAADASNIKNVAVCTNCHRFIYKM